MNQCGTPLIRLRAPGLASVHLCPRDAARLLHWLVRTVAVAIIIIVLAASLVHASQVTTRMVGSMVSPGVGASLTSPTASVDRDLQDRVDQYLTELGTGQAAQPVGVQP